MLQGQGDPELLRVILSMPNSQKSLESIKEDLNRFELGDTANILAIDSDGGIVRLHCFSDDCQVYNDGILDSSSPFFDPDSFNRIDITLNSYIGQLSEQIKKQIQNEDVDYCIVTAENLALHISYDADTGKNQLGYSYEVAHIQFFGNNGKLVGEMDLYPNKIAIGEVGEISFQNEHAFRTENASATEICVPGLE